MRRLIPPSFLYSVYEATAAVGLLASLTQLITSPSMPRRPAGHCIQTRKCLAHDALLKATFKQMKHDLLVSDLLGVQGGDICHCWTEPGELFPPLSSLCARLSQPSAGYGFIFDVQT